MSLAKIMAAQQAADQAAKAKSSAEQAAKAKSHLELLLTHSTSHIPTPPTSLNSKVLHALQTPSSGLRAILCAQPEIKACLQAVAIEPSKIVIVIDISNLGGKVSRVIVKALEKYQKQYNIMAVYVVGSDLTEEEDHLLSRMFGDIYHIITYTRNENDTEVEEVDKHLAEIIRTASQRHRGMDRLICFTGDGNRKLGSEGIWASILDVVERGVDLEICAPIGSISKLYKDDGRINIVDLRTFTSSASHSCALPPSSDPK